jgi:hypothetical protein
MLTAGKLVGILTTTDYEKARRFYEEMLGFEFVSLDHFALAMRAGVNMIRISKSETFKAAQSTVLGWEVQDLKATVLWLRSRGHNREVRIRPGSGIRNLVHTGRRSGCMVQGSRRQCSIDQPPRLDIRL